MTRYAKLSVILKNPSLLFIVAYCGLLVSFSRYAPNLDDMPFFLHIYNDNAVEILKHTQNNMRFYPFGFLDLFILSKISSNPYLYFGFNATLFAVFCVIYLKMLDLSNGAKKINLAILATLTLSVGFVQVYFGICYPEKIQVFWLAIFMLSSFIMLNNPSKLPFLAGILSLNLALYYKEPTFILAIAFGLVYLIFSTQKRYAIYTLASAVLYGICYAFVLLFNDDGKYSRLVEGSNAVAMTLRGYLDCALSDSLIIFGIGGLFVYRIALVFIHKKPSLPFYDACLAGSFAYLGCIIGLGIYEEYYLLPCYVLGIPPLVYFFKLYFHKAFIKVILVFGLFGFLTQNLPSGIYSMINFKAQGVQLHRTLDFSAEYLKQNDKARLFFEGVGDGVNLYGFDNSIYVFSAVVYLHRIYGVNAVKWKTNAKPYKDALLYTTSFDTPKKGDLIIYNQWSAFDSPPAENLHKELIYTSGFPTIPRISLKWLLCYANAKYLKLESEVFWQGSNCFALPLQSQVFKVS